jgi:hypothetical protein
VLELAARPKQNAIASLTAMAGLNRHDATALVHHYQSARG